MESGQFCHSRGFCVGRLPVGLGNTDVPAAPSVAFDSYNGCLRRSAEPRPENHSGIDTRVALSRTWWVGNCFGGDMRGPLYECGSSQFPDYHYYRIWRYTGDLWQDHENVYSPQGLGLLAAGVGVHAVLANTSLDREFRNWVQDDVVRGTGDFGVERHLGDYKIVVPALVGLWGVGEWLRYNGCHCSEYHAVGDWARQSTRALIIGAPVTGVLQVAIGSSRPKEGRGSEWRPFADSNAVSGHAFVGAVPFLVAAERTGCHAARVTLYVGSTISAWSRVYEDKHYLSQALLGWWIAWLSTKTTSATEASCYKYRIVPMNCCGDVAIGVEARY